MEATLLSALIFDEIEYRVFNRMYAVSRCGKVLRKTSVPYAPKIRRDGYVYAGRDNLIHRMVATCWLEKPEGAKLVHHKNGNKIDNHADNLEWVTAKQHMGERHADIVGRHVVTEVTRLKMRLARLGTKDYVEVRLKKADILRSVSVRKHTCEVDGVLYRSFLSASKATGIHFHTIRYRCLSKNFPNYSLVTI